MDSSLEHNSKQASQAESTREEIEQMDEERLLVWINTKRPGLLKDEDCKKLKEARISGRVFLMQEVTVEVFENKCHLPIGVSLELADLAREIAGGETAGVVQKGKEQDTSTGKSTDHAPLLFSLH
jgi:hypothetical protein